MTATLISNYGDLAEWLLLFAVIAFVIAGCLVLTNRPDPTRGSLLAFGLALMALAFLVL